MSRYHALADANVSLFATFDPLAALTRATDLAVPTVADGVIAFTVSDAERLTIAGQKTTTPLAKRALDAIVRFADGRGLDAVLAQAHRHGCVVVDVGPGLVTDRAHRHLTRPPGVVPDAAQCTLLPLRVHDHALALLVLYRPVEGDGRAPSLTRAFAASVTVALDNARRYAALQRATHLRDRILGTVSHDVRNSLAAIAFCANALESDATSPDERRRLTGRIHDAVDLSQRLLADLVDVAAIEAGQLSVSVRRVDPIILLSRCVDLFDGGASDVPVRLAPGLPEWLPAISADEQRILQVMGNLVSNARKATPVTGSITLGAALVPGAVEFAVRDTGSGITPDDQQHIFDWFWRAPREGVKWGAGLGLAIAKGIVAAHGGWIGVSSVPGAGATFTFRIPLAEPNVALDSPAASPLSA
jgi:signal transduction histidine kinase